ncbi:MAG: dihydrolipoyl dehydrogenase, partial [Firmicutes bacterium]|nr:dihydrolipoyl dehydrogenase [Bacillota bacterium]
FGVDASVLIGEISLAVDRGLTLEMVAESVHAHPTLSEIIMEVAKQALGRAFYK